MAGGVPQKPCSGETDSEQSQPTFRNNFISKRNEEQHQQRREAQINLQEIKNSSNTQGNEEESEGKMEDVKPTLGFCTTETSRSLDKCGDERAEASIGRWTLNGLGTGSGCPSTQRGGDGRYLDPHIPEKPEVGFLSGHGHTSGLAPGARAVQGAEGGGGWSHKEGPHLVPPRASAGGTVATGAVQETVSGRTGLVGLALGI